ncbi:MAG: NrfD/PsrC family molybdoenzyme membrane anchor subunit, partial [Terriglobales bacterium]
MNGKAQPARFSASSIARAGAGGGRGGEGAAEPYYGIPFLKRPTWKWQIAGYFFLGGIAGASFALAALADGFRSPDAAALRRAGFETSLAALLPCPGLLIWDLGLPRRFPYMLRVWKPGSPMNLGSWLLTGFGGVSMIGAVHAMGQAGVLGPLSPLARRLPMRMVSVAGLPLALGMTGYTGVLLAGTSVPVWNQSPWMGGVFVASSFAGATEVLRLHLTVRRPDASSAIRALDQIGHAAKAAETGLLAAHCLRSGRAGRALWWG